MLLAVKQIRGLTGRRFSLSAVVLFVQIILYLVAPSGSLRNPPCAMRKPIGDWHDRRQTSFRGVH